VKRHRGALIKKLREEEVYLRDVERKHRTCVVKTKAAITKLKRQISKSKADPVYKGKLKRGDYVKGKYYGGSEHGVIRRIFWEGEDFEVEFTPPRGKPRLPYPFSAAPYQLKLVKAAKELTLAIEYRCYTNCERTMDTRIDCRTEAA